jgi:purine-cytosine permease-like protein
VPRIRFGKYSVVLPGNRLVRLGLGVALVILGGFFGFLPILGYWMVPVGFLILATDVPVIRRFNRRVTVAVVGWWTSRKSHTERKAARRTGPAAEPANSDS